MNNITINNIIIPIDIIVYCLHAQRRFCSSALRASPPCCSSAIGRLRGYSRGLRPSVLTERDCVFTVVVKKEKKEISVSQELLDKEELEEQRDLLERKDPKEKKEIKV